MKKVFSLLLLILQSINLPAQQNSDWITFTPPGSPEARYGHSMVTLPDGRVMMFGGEGVGQNRFNDLHAYENANWVELTPDNSSPPPRRDHQAWLEGSDRMYVYGGIGETGPLNDLWVYNINTNNWTEIFYTGVQPPARYGHATTTTGNGTKLILGGKDVDGNKLNDFYKINPDNSCTQLANAPRYYYNHAVTLIDDDLLLVFGKAGFIGLYQLSVGVWGETPGGLPLNEINTYVSSGNQVFIFGGKDENGVLVNNVYAFNTTTGEVTTREEPLPAMIENGASAFIQGSNKNTENRILLFGGIVNNEISNACWESTFSIPVSTIEYILANDPELKVGPNPAKNHLYIQAAHKMQDVSIYDIRGKLIFTSAVSNVSETILDIQSINCGIYIIGIKFKDGRLRHQKIVINE